MNSEQAKSIVRHIVSFVGGLLAAWGISKSNSDNLTAIFNSETVIGVLAWALSQGWSYLAKTKIGLILAATGLVKVTGIEVNDPQLASDLRDKDVQAKVTVR